jgi:hypothetical protein
MRIALTANGPGEVAGWIRPLLRALYTRAPETNAHVFLVPDDYATGHEAKTIRSFFPQAGVYDPKTYVRFALGRDVRGVPDRVDLVQYAGGDLLHAARLHARLKGRAATYKFSRKRYRETFDRAYAVDRANVEQLLEWGTPEERIETVGNLAIDGALLEAQGEPEAGSPEDGILIMPGTRPHEVAQLYPLFFTAALKILQERPEIPIAFGLSPFTPPEQVRVAIERSTRLRAARPRGAFGRALVFGVARRTLSHPDRVSGASCRSQSAAGADDSGDQNDRTCRAGKTGGGGDAVQRPRVGRRQRPAHVFRPRAARGRAAQTVGRDGRRQTLSLSHPAEHRRR